VAANGGSPVKTGMKEGRFSEAALAFTPGGSGALVIAEVTTEFRPLQIRPAAACPDAASRPLGIGLTLSSYLALTAGSLTL
jgi:hypothetical protein